MNRVLILLCIAAFCYACGNENKQEIPNEFVLSGKIQGLDSGTVVLKYYDGSKLQATDSAVLEEGSFTMSGSVTAPEMYYLSINDSRPISFFLENANINMTGHIDSLSDVTITGSVLQDKYAVYDEKMKEFRNGQRALYEDYKMAKEEGNEEEVKRIDSIRSQAYEDRSAFTQNFIAKNSNNVIGPYLATGQYFNDESLDELDSLLKTFTGEALNTSYVARLSEMVRTWKQVAVGEVAIDFTQNDTLNNPVTLSSLRGQYVLIDFWASWCGPCRAENPNVVKLYNELSDKGFEIIGVSFDSDKEKWLKAIKDDNLTWYHVSDLGGWGNEVGKLYGVRAIPHTILLDPDGVIIDKNLRGEALRERLEELLAAS
ncbi:redoxin domain-containing protein [Splendidivirga corallicola]|uniref:redoxin domain-containing protein n=1 Tax=Splendidivirga corallicola TaxID=3051826 RepID=UPI003211C8B3